MGGGVPLRDLIEKTVVVLKDPLLPERSFALPSFLVFPPSYTRNGSPRATRTHRGRRGLVRALRDQPVIRSLINAAIESLISKVWTATYA